VNDDALRAEWGAIGTSRHLRALLRDGRTRMKDSDFLELLTRLGLSWVGYRKVRKGVKRRISRHMQRLSLRTIGEYLLELEENPEVREETWRLLAVPISRFFRDVAL
jgi:chemotaxis protein methyltransferase CheR